MVAQAFQPVHLGAMEPQMNADARRGNYPPLAPTLCVGALSLALCATDRSG